MTGAIAKITASITRVFYPRGTQRMLRIFFNPKKFRLKGVMKYDKTLRINFNTSSYVEWELFFRGFYEKWVIDLMKKIIKKDDVVVDAGANIGTHTLIMAKLAGEGGKVFAFDPDVKSVERLNENVGLNGLKNVKIFSSGLSDKPGVLTLFLYNSEMSDQGTASFYELPRLQNSKLEVPVQTLDEAMKNEQINRLNFIKIDTRGSDFPIIKGSRGNLVKFRPYVVFEYNSNNWKNSGSKWEEAKVFFDDLSYELYLITPKGLLLIGGKADDKTSYNILALPKEKMNTIKNLIK